MRKLLHILSALLIAVTAQSYAQARAAEDPSGRMVLCIGAAVVVVLTDADGQPVEVPHTCPEATLLLAAGPALPDAAPPVRVEPFVPAAAAILSAGRPAPRASARAPPAVI
ncbi:MAG: hypothetical protein AAGF60_02600 [Pseudomonadota bacterium]